MMKKEMLFVFALIFGLQFIYAAEQGKSAVPSGKTENKSAEQNDGNLIDKRFRNFPSFNRNGRSAVIRTAPGKQYLIRASVKLQKASTNPDTAVRFVIQEEGKRAMKSFEWYKINADTFTNMSCIYTPSKGVVKAVIILKPRFTAEEKGQCKDFSAVEIEEIDE